jgi:hypothetical protein
MTRDDFKDWMKDFRARFPQSGTWLYGLDRDTLRTWFDDVFSNFELRDAKAVNYQLMMGDGEIEAWQRERLPAIYIRRMQEQLFRRRAREEDAKEKRRERERRSRLSDGSCATSIAATLRKSGNQSVDDLRLILQAYKKEHGKDMPDDLRSEAYAEYWRELENV